MSPRPAGLARKRLILQTFSHVNSVQQNSAEANTTQKSRAKIPQHPARLAINTSKFELHVPEWFAHADRSPCTWHIVVQTPSRFLKSSDSDLEKKFVANLGIVIFFTLLGVLQSLEAVGEGGKRPCCHAAFQRAAASASRRFVEHGYAAPSF